MTAYKHVARPKRVKKKRMVSDLNTQFKEIEDSITEKQLSYQQTVSILKRLGFLTFMTDKNRGGMFGDEARRADTLARSLYSYLQKERQYV